LPELVINLLLQQTWQGFSFTRWLLLLCIIEDIKTLPPLQASQSQEEEFSRPVNKTSVKLSVWESEPDPPSWQVSIRTTSTWGDWSRAGNSLPLERDCLACSHQL